MSEAPAPPAQSHRRDCLVHGDRAAEHILYDSATRSLTGVIDWSEVSIGDPDVSMSRLVFGRSTRRFPWAVRANERLHPM
ncbi:MAG: phosphotransferase [Spirochaetota bacterium]